MGDGDCIHLTIYGPVTVYGAPARPQWRWQVGPTRTKGTPMPLELTMTTEEQIRVYAVPTTGAGADAPLDGPISYAVTAGDCTVAPIDDLSCWVMAGSVGTSTVAASADADLGAGFVPVEDVVTVHVVSPQAESLGLQADAPVLKP